MSATWRRWRKPAVFMVSLLVLLALLLTGCGQSTGSKASTGNTGNTGSAGQIPAAVQAAAKRGYILIGYPNPSTGPLASLGAGANWVAQQALAAINKNGGIYIKSLGKKLPVKMQMMDTQSTTTEAAQVATELVNKDKVNMMLVLYTPDVVNPVCAIAERYHVPTVALAVPTDSWLTGGPYKWSYDAFWNMNTIVDVYLNCWKPYKSQTDKVVGILCPNDTDGINGAKLLHQKLPADGYKIVDPGRFPDNTNDFTALINEFKKGHVQIIVGWMPPPTFAEVWRQMHEQGFVPKIATIGKALLMPADVSALGGNLPEGLTSEIWWSPVDSPYKEILTGQTPQQLIDDWEKAKGTEGPQTVGFDWGGWELVNDVLTRAQSVDPNVLLHAIATTDLNSVVGPIKFNDQHYSATPVVCGQWVKGSKWPWEIRAVSNTLYPVIPTTAKMVFPLPK